MGTNNIRIRFFNNPKEAPTYNRPEFKHAEVTEAVLVRNGTAAGSPTVDLVFTDEKGQKYISMITAKLLQQVLELAK
jgi:hypothetical protein